MGLIMVLGFIFAGILISLFGIFAGGAALIALLHVVIPVIVSYFIAKIVYQFLKQIF